MQKTYSVHAVECDNGKTVYEVGQFVTGSNAPFSPQSKVKSIGEKPSQGPGDLWFYGIEFENGFIHRVFNPTRAVLKPDNIIVPDNKLILQ